MYLIFKYANMELYHTISSVGLFNSPFQTIARRILAFLGRGYSLRTMAEIGGGHNVATLAQWLGASRAGARAGAGRGSGANCTAALPSASPINK
jgi:hypothetical protein